MDPKGYNTAGLVQKHWHWLTVVGGIGIARSKQWRYPAFVKHMASGLGALPDRRSPVGHSGAGQHPLKPDAAGLGMSKEYVAQMSQLFSEMQRRYREGDLPWDQPLPPPEVIDLADKVSPGRTLDLGCGAGRACIYLAQRGWQCDGVDFVPEAIAMARQRATAAGVSERARFHVAPVTQLDFLEPFYDLALDVGCLHGQQDQDREVYAVEVARLVRPGGSYVLFAHLRDEPALPGLRGIPEMEVVRLFRASFVIDRAEHGVTQFAETSVASAWFWMTRRT